MARLSEFTPEQIAQMLTVNGRQKTAEYFQCDVRTVDRFIKRNLERECAYKPKSVRLECASALDAKGVRS